MIAVILSGGRSTRMGEDKGLIQDHGVSWVEKLQHQLRYLGISVYISVNALQQVPYQSRLPAASKLIVDDPLEGVNGPLKGILSAHHMHPQLHILFLPADMPLLNAPVFDLWLKCFDKYYPQYHIFISRTAERLQPLCGIYSREGLQILDTLYQKGQLQNQSMHAVTEHPLRSFHITIPDSLVPLFKNFNTPEDLNK